MYIHDWADITTSFIKVVIETHYKLPLYIVGISNTVFWGITRLYIFPCIVIYEAFYLAPNYMIEHELPKVPGAKEYEYMFRNF